MKLKQQFNKIRNKYIKEIPIRDWETVNMLLIGTKIKYKIKVNNDKIEEGEGLISFNSTYDELVLYKPKTSCKRFTEVIITKKNLISIEVSKEE